MNSLHENGIPDDLLSVEAGEPVENVRKSEIFDNANEFAISDDSHSDVDVVYNKDSGMSIFLQLPETEQQEKDDLLEQLHNQIVDWQTTENEPLNEFTTPFLAMLSFPTLFPNSDADPTNPAILREVSFAEIVKHFIKYKRKVGNRWTFPFGSDPRYSYWALNMIHTKRMSQQASVFIKQDPGEAHFTSEELRKLVETNNDSLCCQRCVIMLPI